jgi:outer membrane protein assembly factor BamB
MFDLYIIGRKYFLKKNVLTIGVIVLFIILALAPMSFGYNHNTVNNLESQPTSINNGGLMDSAWPMTGHDLHHTSRSPYGNPGNYLVEKWKVQLDKPAHYGCSPVVAKDGTIYIATGITNDILHAINPNGTIKWKYNVSGHYTETLFTPAIGADGTIYVNGDEEEFYAFYPNGTVKWIIYLKEQGCSSPAISDDGTIFVGGGNNMYAIYTDGSVKWVFPSGSEIGTSPAIDDNGIVYFSSTEGYLFALYPNNGTMKWKCMINDLGGNWISPVIGDDGNIYILGGYKLRGIAPNGSKIWKVISAGSRGLSLGYDGTLYTGSGHLRAYTSQGEEIWEVEDIGYSRNVAIDKNGMLYVISDNADGDEKARLMQISPDAKILTSVKPSVDFDNFDCYMTTHPVIAEDGTIYVATYYRNRDPPYDKKGFLHAFEVLNVENLPPELPTISGPSTGKQGVKYNFSVVSTDPDGDNVSYMFELLEYRKWSKFFPSGDSYNISYTWDYSGEIKVRARAQDIYGGMSNWEIHKIFIEGPPNAPTITGPNSCKPGTKYVYKFKTIDPEDDYVSYYIDWGDGNITDWTGYQPWWEQYSESHTWTTGGPYTIRAKAKDTDGDESDWGTLTVTMPRDKAVTNNMLLLRILERFPLLQKLLLFLK